MISRLILLKVLVNEEKPYTIAEIKQELDIEEDEHLYGIFMKYLSKCIKILDGSKQTTQVIKKLVGYIEELIRIHPSLLKEEGNREKIIHIYREISKKSDEQKNHANSETLKTMNYLFEKMSFMETTSVVAMIHKSNELYAYLMKIIFEEQNYRLFKELTKIHPQMIGIQNPNNQEPFYVTFFKKYLRRMNKEIKLEELLYYGQTSERMIDLMKHLNYDWGEYQIQSEIDKKIENLQGNPNELDRQIKMMLLSKLKERLSCEKDNLDNPSFINYKCHVNRGHSSDIEQYIKEISIDSMCKTDEHIYTIDAENTLALDDALSVKRLPNGNYLLGIYISDVAGFIPKGSELDRNACKRGATIYLHNGKQIPMLPKQLSNHVFSLLPNTPKKVLALFVEINKDGHMEDYLLKRCTIQVNHRMTYNEVDNLIRDLKNNGRIANDLRLLYEVSSLLSRHTNQKNHYREVDQYLGNKNEHNMEKITKISDTKKSFSHSIVSECMILMNYLLAKIAAEQKIPFIYRVHEMHNVEELKRKYSVLSSMVCIDGECYDMDNFKHQIMNAYIKPQYSGLNKGHNGLGLDYYSHTTSPIRRYCDCFNQRIINDMVLNTNPTNQEYYYFEEYAPKVAFIQNENEELIEKFLMDYHLQSIEAKERRFVRK